MGAWGIKNFENDDALELVADMDDDGWPYILDAIENVIIVPDDQYLDAHDCCRALAAMEYVAAVQGKPSSDLPEEAADWIKHKHTEALTPDTVADAICALKRITTNSELKELWEETGEFDDWLAVTKDLEARIQ